MTDALRVGLGMEREMSRPKGFLREMDDFTPPKADLPEEGGEFSLDDELRLDPRVGSGNSLLDMVYASQRVERRRRGGV